MIVGFLLAISISVFLASTLMVVTLLTEGIIPNPLTGNVIGVQEILLFDLFILGISFIFSAVLLLKIIRPKKNATTTRDSTRALFQHS